MAFFKNTGLTNTDALFDELKARLVANGWVAHVANATLGDPGTPRIGREEIFVAPDTAAHPGGHIVGLVRFRDAASNNGGGLSRIGLYGATGWSGLKAITSLTREATPTPGKVTAVVPSHGFLTGQLVGVNGNSNTAFHVGASPETGTGGETAPNTITKIDDNTFSYVMGSTTAISGTGGYAFSVFNPACWRHAIGSANGASWSRILLPADGAMSVYGYCDAHRICGIVVQGAVYRTFHAGLMDRSAHVATLGNSVGRLTGAVTGDGTTKTLDLDRSCPNMYAGQPLWFLAQNSARPDVAGYQSSLHTTTIVAVNSATQITAVVPNGVTYPIGTIVGWDPCPIWISGPSVSAVTNTMNTYNGYSSHSADATRGANPIGQTSVAFPIDPNVADVGPGADGFYRLFDINCERTTSPLASRGPLVGLLASSFLVQANLDIMREGPASAAPTNDYVVFASQLVNAANILAIGPGAF